VNEEERRANVFGSSKHKHSTSTSANSSIRGRDDVLLYFPGISCRGKSSRGSSAQNQGIRGSIVLSRGLTLARDASDDQTQASVPSSNNACRRSSSQRE
jgi:hypothetical protein